jgi:integrase
MRKSNKTKSYQLLNLLTKFINDSKSGKRLQPNGKRIAKTTLVNYIHFHKILSQYETTLLEPIRFIPLNRLGIRQRAQEKKYWAAFYRNFTDFMYKELKYFDNTVGTNIKILRALFNYLKKTLLYDTGDFHLLFYVRKEQIPVVVLTPEQLHYLIYNKKFEKTLSYKLEKVKDIFVFGCTVALRVTDLLNLKPTNLLATNAGHYLIVRSQKTGTDSQVKLPDYCVAIINKYKGKYPTLLPRLHKANLNKYIKELVQQAGFTQLIAKPREKRGKRVEITKTFYGKQLKFSDMVSTHTMRRTAITTMLILGMPEQLVRRISGHKANSAEFFKYVTYSQAYQDNETDKHYERFKQIDSVPA